MNEYLFIFLLMVCGQRFNFGGHPEKKQLNKLLEVFSMVHGEHVAGGTRAVHPSFLES